jgi:hypothetical protein
VLHPERELRWLGHLLLPGVFDGEHYFLLEPIGDNGTRLTQGERFAGILVGLFGGTLTATGAGFRAMNAALKREAEKEIEAKGLRGELNAPLSLQGDRCVPIAVEIPPTRSRPSRGQWKGARGSSP